MVSAPLDLMEEDISRRHDTCKFYEDGYSRSFVVGKDSWSEGIGVI